MFALVDAYRRLGHLTADIDPLDRRAVKDLPELDPEFHNLALNYVVTDHDISSLRLPEQLSGATVLSLLKHLKNTYCASVAAEFMSIQDVIERHWMIDKIESISSIPVSPGLQKNMLSLMYQSELFDDFMQKKFRSFKRYGLEGEESFLVALHTLLTQSVTFGVKDVVIGMPHRGSACVGNSFVKSELKSGRLNFLVALLDYPPRALFSKVKGACFTSELGQIGSDDVASHIATSVTKKFDNRDHIHISLLHNPSHLEAVNPVALGKVKAFQDIAGDSFGDFSLCIQLHGDAAFSGQGVVTESLQLSQLKGFFTGGSVHIILNNQIGYTTEPIDSRSGPYATDVAAMLHCPIIHVNGEDPEAVYRACVVALNYRKRFKKDFFIDVHGYRKHGHNEVDEPGFTQPSMYKNIRSRKSITNKYAEMLNAAGIKTESVLEKVKVKVNQFLETELNLADGYKPDPKWNFQCHWEGYIQPSDMKAVVYTGVDLKVLKQIGLKSVELPEGFSVHPRLAKSHISARIEMMQTGTKIDWATAEAIAFGALLKDGYNIRLSGQDVQRGTFSQRHATFTDQNTDEKYTPLCHFGENCGKFYPVNSHLSEFGVLGFEFGYSWESPKNMSIWEAQHDKQFGDFWNTAQVIVDNFIASGEAKWIRQSGIVMLLPHGYDGAGPEHSNAKIERLLSLCDSDEFGGDDKVANLSVINCTTPANYFHALRRQMSRNFRKPLIVIAPKTILRLPEATSTLQEFEPGTSFNSVIGEPNDLHDATVTRVICCSGKIYYDLVKARSSMENGNELAILRLEELCPFPTEKISEQLLRYNNKKQILWVQEEPANGGAWSFVSPRMSNMLEHLDLPLDFFYVGRKASASPATGASQIHKQECKELLETVFSSELHGSRLI